ncbi:MAG: type I phosphomannose isomerase catalytic subunit [Planctomycetota bacterium]
MMPDKNTNPFEDIKWLRFEPLLKRTIWGGRGLGTRLGKAIGEGNDFAESWEIVDHGHDQSVVMTGPLQGQTLGNLFVKHTRWLMGDHWVHTHTHADRFPLLLKFLDCNRVLSVQVHPDDAYGRTMTPPDLGKTEAWVVLHAEQGAKIYAGLKSEIDRETLKSMIDAGETEAALHAFEPQAGDCIFIPAGTVHALGAGLMIAEIQQSSDTTFRLFDWNRVGDDGQSRPLHIEQSLAVMDYSRGPVHPIVPAATTTIKQIEPLVRCDKFELDRIQLDVGQNITIGNSDRCEIACLTSGTADDLQPGDSWLIPAASGPMTVQANDALTLLTMRPV